MKLIAEYKNKVINREGKINLIFTVEPKMLGIVESLKNELYELEIKKPSSKRSTRQNAYLWALINEICMFEDGNTSHSEELYLTLLEISGAKYTIVSIDKKAYDDFAKLVRHSKILDETETTYTLQVFIGSSRYNSKEMTQLIETTLRYASELGIETAYWADLLKQ